MSYIIMKYDDLSFQSLNAFERVAEFSLRMKWPVSLGVIGQSLSFENEFYKNRLKKWIEKGIEIWNHGYYHTVSEFSTAPYELQCQSIIHTQKLIESKLGYRAVTFGSPHNNSTETTIRALRTVASEIRNYLFAVDGTDSSNTCQFLVRCDMEITTGNIDFEFFKKNYHQLQEYPYMVIQGHPSFWSELDFQNNEKVMCYLRSRGNNFVTPSGYSDCRGNQIMPGRSEECVRQLLSYASIHKKLALYGAGEIGREIYRFLKTKNILSDIFIISDGQEMSERKICALPVVHLSEFLGLEENYGVIVAMMPKFHQEIIETLTERNIEYFCPDNEEKYMKMIHYVRNSISFGT